ncbi:MAG: arylesterase [Chloroflexi bacterium]|nr:arylesterase [Chloroflexota bacterium]
MIAWIGRHRRLSARAALLPFCLGPGAALLAACGIPFAGGASAPRTYAPDDGRPAVVCLGDSLTAGDAAPEDQSYPAWLQSRLDRAGYRYRVVNAGVSGDRVADGLARVRDDVLRFRPAVVIVELGSNDPGKTPADVWERQLDTLVARIQGSGAKVILGGLDEPGMADIYRAVASERGTPLVWFTAGLWSRPGLWGDAHHPNGAGYRVVMQSFWPALQLLLRRA